MLELQARNKRQQVHIQSFPLQGPLKVGTTFIQRLNTLQIVRKILTSDHDGRTFLDHSMWKPDANTLRKVREEDEKRTALTSKQEEEELST